MPEDYDSDLDRLGPPGRPYRGAIVLVITVVALLAFVALLAYMMNKTTLDVPVALGLSVALGALCFVRIKWVLYILIFICLFSPELQVGEPGPASKRAITFRIEDILLVVIAVTWLARAAVHEELGLMLRTPLNRSIFAYVIICIVATALGIGYGWVDERLKAALFVLKYIQYFVLFFMIVNHVETRRDVRNIVIAGIVTYLAMCLYGFWQLLDPAAGRPTTFAEDVSEPNTLAGYLIFMMGVCSGLALMARRVQNRIVFGVMFALGLFLLAYTLSRSGWAGLLGILAVLMFAGRHRFAIVAMLATLVCGLVLVSFEVAWLPEPIRERVDETRGVYEWWPGRTPPPAEVFGFRLDPSASARYWAYKASLGAWLERSAEHWVPLLTGCGVLGGRTFIDGQYVRVLVETGLLGLAAFLAVLFAIWRHVWRSYKVLQEPWHRGLVLGYLAGFAGLLVHALAANTFIIVRIMEPFFIFTGVVVVLAEIERGETGPAPPEFAKGESPDRVP